MPSLNPESAGKDIYTLALAPLAHLQAHRVLALCRAVGYAAVRITVHHQSDALRKFGQQRLPAWRGGGEEFCAPCSKPAAPPTRPTVLSRS